MNRFRAQLERIAARPRWAALALGALAALGFQPLALWPLALLGVAGLIALTARAATWKRAALIGWCFGLGHFAVGINWIATAFTYQANMPAWLGWVAVLLSACYLAIFPALVAGTAWLSRARPMALVLAFAGTWIISEWLRSWVFTGFAWNPLGAVLLGSYRWPALAGVTGWLGSYALSGLAVLLAGGWWLALRARRPGWREGALVLLPWLLMLQPGSIRITDPSGGQRYTLVQPDIRQDILNDPATFEDQFAKITALSKAAPAAKRLVLWPESGVPDYLRDGYPPQYYGWTYNFDPVQARVRLARVIGPQSVLLTGTSDLVVEAGKAAGAHNVVTALGGSGAILGSYAKAHLVPGGEYLPLRWLLEPLGAGRLVPGSIDYWAGPGPRTLDLGEQGKVGVQICYEIIFSGQVTDRANRPDFLFNPSNDGWFGSWGPPQHLAQARLRAIEEGLPVLRATTTGISAVIDADGIVRQHVPRHVAGRLDGVVPPAHAPTLFARLGNLLPLGWAIVLLGLSLVALRRRPR
jgi:apolipoprotein N-acyltransferase